MPVNLEGDIYTLDDGTEITYKELAVKLRCSDAGARARLDKYSNPKAVFAPMGKIPKRLKKAKKHKMDDGKEYTAYDISVITGIPVKTIRHRLFAGWDNLERLATPPMKTRSKEYKEKLMQTERQMLDRAIKARNYFDDLSRLALRAI